MNETNTNTNAEVEEWFWARGIYFVLRALSLHGLTGASLALSPF